MKCSDPEIKIAILRKKEADPMGCMGKGRIL